MLRTLLVLSRHNSSFLCILSLCIYILYDWITMIMGHSKHELSTLKNHVVLPTKLCYNTPNDSPITATSPKRPLSSVPIKGRRCGAVQLYLKTTTTTTEMVQWQIQCLHHNGHLLRWHANHTGIESVHTLKWWFQRDFCNRAKLRHLLQSVPVTCEYISSV